MAIRLLPFDPSAALLARVAELLREGIDDWSACPQPQPAWAEGEVAPAEHYLAPAGARLFIGTDPGAGVKCSPAIILHCPEDGKEKSPEVKGAWAIWLWVDIRCQKDGDLEEAEALLRRIQFMVTHPIVLDDDSVEQPQERLSTAELHVFGAHHRDNFEESVHGKLEDVEDHPAYRFSTRITCAIYGEIPA